MIGEETLEPLVLVHSRCVLVTSPRPPVRTATAATPERPPIDQSTPSLATTLGTMYQPMSLAQDHSCSPVPGSNASTLRNMATTSSVLPSALATRTGVFQASRMSLARQTSLPVLRSSATRL